VLFFVSAVSCGHTQATFFLSSPDLLKEIQVVGVLPLENLTDSPEAAQIVTDLLVTELHHLERFRVLGQTDVQRTFQGQQGSFPKIIDRAMATEIGRRLQVDGVLIGSVTEFQYQVAAADPREEKEPVIGINLRLINVRTSTVVWGSSYARSSYEVFAYEKDALTRVVTKALRGMLVPLSKN
jgi:TolB-like protein